MFDRSPVKSSKSQRPLILSIAAHGAVVLALFAVRFDARLKLPSPRNTRVTLLAPTALLRPQRIAIRTPSKRLEIRATKNLPAPIQIPAAPRLAEAPELTANPVPAIVSEPSPIAPRRVIIQPDVFSSAVVNPSPLKSVAVQAAGFSAVSTASTQSARTSRVVAGGFGDTATGIAAGVRRTVAQGGGFGDAGIAATAVSSTRPVRATGFGDAVLAPSTAGTRPAHASQPSAAQILEKPRPAYTEEARRLRIEGEVQLEVRFRATGEIDIVRVVRGLGYGLDENAAQAARTIRFLPAKRDGRPVDSTATVHILFQLAS